MRIALPVCIVCVFPEARKITKSVVSVVKSSQLSSGDQWIVQDKQTAASASDSEPEDLPPKKKQKTNTT